MMMRASDIIDIIAMALSQAANGPRVNAGAESVRRLLLRHDSCARCGDAVHRTSTCHDFANEPLFSTTRRENALRTGAVIARVSMTRESRLGG
jgi:hypothetical protein